MELQWNKIFESWISIGNIDGLLQEKRNSSAKALELRLYCTNPLIFSWNGRMVLIVLSTIKV